MKNKENYLEELELSSRDQKRLMAIMDECEVCNGKGYFVTVKEDGAYFTDCDCTKKMLYDQKLMLSGIPARYLTWSIDDLYDQFKADNPQEYQFIMNFIENLKDNVDNGNSFWMASPPGLAKSSISAYIAKKVIEIGYTAYFATASKIVEKKFDNLGKDNNGFIDYLLYDTNFLVIEEIDKVYLRDDANMANHLFYEFLLELYDQQKSVIITSNKTKDEFICTLPSYIKDRFSEYKYVVLKGKYSGRS